MGTRRCARIGPAGRGAKSRPVGPGPAGAHSPGGQSPGGQSPDDHSPDDQSPDDQSPGGSGVAQGEAFSYGLDQSDQAPATPAVVTPRTRTRYEW